MKTKFIRILFLSFGVALLSGCATTYAPSASVPKLSEVSGIPVGVKVSLINAQPATEKIEISQHGTGYTVYANLNVWTDREIRALNRTLQKKGAVVTDNATKSLKVAVTKPILSIAASGWAFRCTIVFTIETGDGQTITLGADDTSWKWPNACDGAMQKAVLVALHDDRILKYLASP